jgi:hypothetical protein
MEDIQTSEVNVKLTPVNVWKLRVRFSNHGNQTILVSQLKPTCAAMGAKANPQ